MAIVFNMSNAPDINKILKSIKVPSDEVASVSFVVQTPPTGGTG